MVILDLKFEEGKNEIGDQYKEYCNKNSQRILAYRTLSKGLKLMVKNFSLSLKSGPKVNRDISLSPCMFNWISLSWNSNVSGEIQKIEDLYGLEYLIDRIYNLQNQFLNILNNHYTIRNSLDTHFVVTKLDEIEKILQRARNEISKAALGKVNF